MQQRRVALALALLCGGISADPAAVETSTFYGACSADKCTNVFATFDETDGKCEDSYVRTILGATMSVTYASAAVADPSSIRLKLGSENYETAVSGASTPCTAELLASGTACSVVSSWLAGWLALGGVNSLSRRFTVNGGLSSLPSITHVLASCP